MHHLAGAARLLLALLGLFMATLALATPGSRFDDSMPPARYQQDATVTVHYTTRPLSEKACGIAKLDPTQWVLNGCVVHPPGRVDTYLPNPCSTEFAGQSFARYACHEMGHYNGWPGTHPQP